MHGQLRNIVTPLPVRIYKLVGRFFFINVGLHFLSHFDFGKPKKKGKFMCQVNLACNMNNMLPIPSLCMDKKEVQYNDIIQHNFHTYT